MAQGRARTVPTIMEDDSIATALSEPPAPPVNDLSAGSVPDVRRVKGADLLNLLNYVNFQEGTIFANFLHPGSGEVLSYQAFPLPAQEGTLVCRWVPPGVPCALLSTLVFQNFLVSDGRSLVTVEAGISHLDRDRIVLQIPEFGYEKSSRKVRRHPAEAVDVEILQAGLRFRGALVDFNAVSFLVELALPQAGALHGLNPQAGVTVLFEKDGALLYSGECRVTRTAEGGRGALVLSPTFNNVRRFPPKSYRSQRHVLNPAPQVTFDHPLTGKPVSLAVTDLSGVGFGLEEFFENSLLLPGLILPRLVLSQGNQVLLAGAGQVLYRNVFSQPSGRSVVRCGVVFLDVDLGDQARLAAMLHQTGNGRIRVCGAVDMEELWRFFFESGFLYPSKYAAIETYKAEFKKVYERLYLESPSISRHFLFEDKGTLFAHMSMVRTYPNAWLIHHHAASKSGYALAGVAVLDQIGQYINEFHSHPSTHMDYVMCYFRRENKFPNRVFGGSYDDVADRKGISLDTFAYLHLTDAMGDQFVPFQIFPSSAQDLDDLSKFYEKESGGLMLDAMGLRGPNPGSEELDAQFRRAGLRREHQVFSLKQQGVLKAVILLQITDLGMNLSNLTNCLHVLVVDPEGLSPQALFTGLLNLEEHYRCPDIPVLVFPSRFLEDRQVPFEKHYALWVLGMTHTDAYFQSLQNRFRRGGHGKP